MKHTLINSVSIITLAVMLTGCDPKSSGKELKQELLQQSQALSALALETLTGAEKTGVPLLSEAEKVLRGEQKTGALPDKPKEMVSDLYAAVDDMDVLSFASSAPSAHSGKLYKVAKELRKEFALKAKFYGEEIRQRNKLAQAKLSEAKRNKELLRAKLELQRASEERAPRIKVLEQALASFQNIENLMRDAALQDSQDLYFVSASTSRSSSGVSVSEAESDPTGEGSVQGSPASHAKNLGKSTQKVVDAETARFTSLLGQLRSPSSDSSDLPTPGGDYSIWGGFNVRGIFWRLWSC